ncbi:hypothetical protein [Mucilaginibacter sp.]|uniref:hypothetical protein n=1 Tax=Mucilaginibacter sp. TaxID=1882438 RepID=UPI003AFFAF62
MKHSFLLIIPIILLLSCKKENSPSFNERITKGEKWGIQIGSTPAEVFVQLQQAGIENNFDEVAIVYRKPSTQPEQIQNQLSFYQAITLQSNGERIDRAIIKFNGEKVTAIDALPVEVGKWPQDLPDETAIHKDDAVASIYAKLQAIYKVQAYSNYQIILPDKTLKKPFDADMGNYDEWYFTFTKNIKSGLTGTSSVRLNFKDGKLSMIQHGYSENVIYN